MVNFQMYLGEHSRFMFDVLGLTEFPFADMDKWGTGFSGS